MPLLAIICKVVDGQEKAPIAMQPSSSQVQKAKPLPSKYEQFQETVKELCRRGRSGAELFSSQFGVATYYTSAQDDNVPREILETFDETWASKTETNKKRTSLESLGVVARGIKVQTCFGSLLGKKGFDLFCRALDSTGATRPSLVATKTICTGRTSTTTP